MAPPSLPYGTHLNDAMDIIKPSLKNYEELPISTNGLYNLVLTIGKYQDTLYDWYAPNYNSDENRIKYLLDMDDTESEIDINRAYKKISTILSILQLVIKVNLPEKVKKSEYDDYFELLLIIHNNLYTNRLSESHEITVVSKQDAKIGEVMHDAWALNTYFTNNSQFEYNYENATENGTRKDRVEQFKYFKELNRLEQLKDYVSYCCVIYAMSQTENIDQIIQDIAPKTGGKKMLKTTERVTLPCPVGKNKRVSVVYLQGKTKYVRKGGEWVTLKKAMQRK